MLNQDLRAMLEAATSDQPFVARPEVALARAKRIRVRRRRVAIGVGSLVVAAAIAVPIATSGSSGSDIDRVVPARPSPAVSAPAATESAVSSLAGVTVSWLPPGMSWTHEITAGPDNYSPLNIVTFFRTGAADGVNDPEVSLSIRPNYTADYLDELARTIGSNGRWLTIHGQRALLQDTSAQSGPGSTDYVLTWTESGTTLALSAFNVSTADLQRTAESVAVGKPTRPKDPGAATAAIKRVLQDVFDGRSSDAQILGGIVNGSQLTPALKTFSQAHPEERTSARIVIGDVVLIDAENAFAIAMLPAAYLPKGIAHTSAELDLQLVNGSWKVSRATYCGALGVLRPSNCPRTNG